MTTKPLYKIAKFRSAAVWLTLWLSGFLCAAEPQEELLQQTGRAVELFWQQMPSFACTESVTQQKISRKGKIEFKQDSVFDYLALTKEQNDDLTIEELRLPLKPAPDKADKTPLLNTNGFPSLQLIFHPSNRADYTYKTEPERTDDGKTLRIRFEHIPGRRSTSALLLQERIYPLALQGEAWIDKETGAIQKIAAGLVTPMKDINIKALNIEVSYKPEHTPSEPATRWLPSSVTVDVRTALQHWRNVHSFSGCKRFTVQSMETLSR